MSPENEGKGELEGMDGGYARASEAKAVTAEDDDVPVRHSDRPWPRAWMGEFLDALTLVPIAAQAARHLGVALSTAYWWRSKDARFAEAWREACEQAPEDRSARLHVIDGRS